jgi:integrase
MNEKPITVTVFRFGARPFLYMQYTNPVTEKKVSRSTGTSNRKEAQKIAAKWEAELQEGRYAKPASTTWAQFRQRYAEEVLPSLAEKTQSKINTVLDAVERIVGPNKLRALDASQLSLFQAKLRKGGRAETTIDGYLAHLSAALQWAVDIGLLPTVPTMPKPERTKSGSKMMKGRAPTGEEFDRMLEKVESVVGPKAAASWRHYLRALWWSGLRLEESLELYWDRQDRLCVDLSLRRPMLRVRAELEKGHQDRLLPIAPEFAEMLLATPEAERHGRVFRLRPRRAHGERLTTCRVSRIVSDIGEAAGVRVNVDQKGKVKFASAHDLRRAFGERWARRPGITPQVLMELMRHESIETTMRFYVEPNAEATADVLWAALDQPQPTGSANTAANSDTESSEVQTADA